MRDLYRDYNPARFRDISFRPRQGNEGFVLSPPVSSQKAPGFRPRQGNEGFVSLSMKALTLLWSMVSVPVRGMRDLYHVRNQPKGRQ